MFLFYRYTKLMLTRGISEHLVTYTHFVTIFVKTCIGLPNTVKENMFGWDWLLSTTVSLAIRHELAWEREVTKCRCAFQEGGGGGTQEGLEDWSNTYLFLLKYMKHLLYKIIEAKRNEDQWEEFRIIIKRRTVSKLLYRYIEILLANLYMP